MHVESGQITVALILGVLLGVLLTSIATRSRDAQRARRATRAFAKRFRNLAETIEVFAAQRAALISEAKEGGASDQHIWSLNVGMHSLFEQNGFWAESVALRDKASVGHAIVDQALASAPETQEALDRFVAALRRVADRISATV